MKILTVRCCCYSSVTDLDFHLRINFLQSIRWPIEIDRRNVISFDIIDAKLSIIFLWMSSKTKIVLSSLYRLLSNFIRFNLFERWHIKAGNVVRNFRYQNFSKLGRNSNQSLLLLKQNVKIKEVCGGM